MTKMRLTLITGLFFIFLSACDVLQQVANDYGIDTGGGLTEREVIQGLKSALEVGTNQSVSILSETNGYFRDAAVKILLPAELNNAVSKLRATDAGEKIYQNVVKDIEDDMILSLNRAAEKAAVKAKPIFINAIKGITIQDGFNILRGADDAATQYLKGRTYSSLVNAFKPDVSEVLSEPVVLNTSPEKLYADFVKAYNEVDKKDVLNLLKIEQIDSPDLSTFVTKKALDGVFLKVAKEEKEIRENPAARINDILKKVFGSVDS